MAFLNSKLCFYITECLNPTVNTQVGDIKRVPFVNPEKEIEIRVALLSEKNIEYTKYIKSFCVYERNFFISPIRHFKNFSDLSMRVKKYIDLENYLASQILINESIINEEIFKIYELSDHDKAMVLAKQGESVGGLPVDANAREAYLIEIDSALEFSIDLIQTYIESLPSKIFQLMSVMHLKSSFNYCFKATWIWKNFVYVIK